MLLRHIAAALAFLICISPITASADFCSGQYQSSSEMVDAAFKQYGTLYTGGDLGIRHSHVGATLDLYRLWHGLPDADFRDHEEPSYEYFESRPSLDEHLNRRLDWVESANIVGEENAKERDVVAVELDNSIVLETPRSSWVRSPDHPLYDWLQMTMIASDVPWTLGVHFNDAMDSRFSAYERLWREAALHYTNSNSLEWAVAAQLLIPPGENDRALDELFSYWQERVLSCQATPGEYAAWASAAANRMLLPVEKVLAAIENPLITKALPKSIFEVIAKNLAYQSAIHSDALPSSMLIALANKSSDPALTAWIGTAGTYRAKSLEELSHVHDGKPVSAYTIRAFNLLSVSDMTRLWQTTKLSSDLHTAMLATIFARNVTLGRDDDAYALLGELQKAYPDHSKRISEIRELWIPMKTKLALVTLDNPSISNWLKLRKSYGGDYNLYIRNTHESRDLPLDLVKGVGVQSDYETWLALPSRWGRVQYSWGMNAQIARIRWSDTRLKPLQPRHDYPLIPDQSTHLPLEGFSSLIAWDELARLQPGQGLTHAVSKNIVAWARDESNNRLGRIFGHRLEASAALREIVLLNRSNDGGMLGNSPAGKVAFSTLKLQFSDSKSAQQTYYWHHGNCESKMTDLGNCWHYEDTPRRISERRSPQTPTFEQPIASGTDVDSTFIGGLYSQGIEMEGERLPLPEGVWEGIAEAVALPAKNTSLRTVYHIVSGRCIADVHILTDGQDEGSLIYVEGRLKSDPEFDNGADTRCSVEKERVEYADIPSSSEVDRLIILGRSEEGRLAELLVIRLQANLQHTGFSTDDCDVITDYPQGMSSKQLGGYRRCYWINHSEAPWEQPIYRLAAEKLRKKGFKLPESVVVTGFRSADTDVAITTQYYSFPDSNMPDTVTGNWETSPWNPAQMSRYLPNQNFIDDRAAWAENWFKQFHQRR